MVAGLRRVAASIPFRAILRDVIFLAGLGTVAYGIYLISTASAIIFAGACAAVLAYLSAPVPNEPTE